MAGAWERQKREGGKITGGGVGKLAGTTREQANGKNKNSMSTDNSLQLGKYKNQSMLNISNLGPELSH